MRIAIINTVCLNGGDAAILEAIVHLLRQAFGPRVELLVFDGHAQVSRRYLPYRLEQRLHTLIAHRGPTRLLPERVNEARVLGSLYLQNDTALRTEERTSIEQLRSCDLVVSTGGTYLVESYDIQSRCFELEVALLLGKPLILATQSLGPFRMRRNRLRLRPSLDRAALVMLRDGRSLGHLQELGAMTSHCHVLPDVVFSLADPARLEATRMRRMPPSKPRVAISVREWHGFAKVEPQVGMERFGRAIAALTIHAAREHGARVEFVSTCQGIPEYWTDDSALAARIVAGLPHDVRSQVTVNRGFRRAAELRDHLAGFDLTVATRMHMAILSLIAGTPVLPIAYEFKTHELFAALQPKGRVVDIETLDGAELRSAFDRALAEMDGSRAELLSGVARMHLQASRAVTLFQDAYERAGGTPRRADS